MQKQDIYQDKYISDVVEKYSDMVLRLAYVYVKNIPDAEDITQDVFIKFFKSKKVFNDMEHIKAWFITVTKNTSKDYLKSWWRKKTDKLKDNIAVSDNYFNSEIVKVVLNLPINYRDIIYLFYYDGYSTIEIAERFNMKEATVRTRLKRGRALLKSKLGGIY